MDGSASTGSDAVHGRQTSAKEDAHLALPRIRCLTREQAADYLGIGLTLLTEMGPPPVRFGRRCVYDVVDLDRWLDEHKQRGRARKEVQWPVKLESTGGATHASGGSILHYPTVDAYAEALGLQSGRKRKRSSPN
jgi:hypothetical protein